MFLDGLKISIFTPVFKGADRSKLGNYRPISMLPCFSNIPERIMYNSFHKYVLEKKILYPKQFDFQVGNSTDHAINLYLILKITSLRRACLLTIHKA